MSDAKRCDICQKYDVGMWAHIHLENEIAGVSGVVIRVGNFGTIYDYDVCSKRCASEAIDRMAR